MVEFIGMLCVAAVFAIISAIAKALTKVTFRHSNMHETKQNVGCLFALYLVTVPFVLGGIIVGGYLLYENVANKLHYKNFTEEDGQKVISDFQNSWDNYSDCGSFIFAFYNGTYYLFPKDDIVEYYKSDRNFNYHNMIGEKYAIYTNSSFKRDMWSKYILDNENKLNAKTFSAGGYGVCLFSSYDNFVQCVDGYIKFDAFILNIREKSIKEIVFEIRDNGKEKTFILCLQDNKPHSCQEVIQKVDNMKCKIRKENDYRIISIIDVIFNE
jgi:hypothetical protein